MTCVLAQLPCGEWSPDQRENRCTCKSLAIRSYRGKITGPVGDRIDITRHVLPLKRGDHDRFRPVESSAVVRERVAAVRARQLARFEGCGWRLNGQIPGPLLREQFPVTPAAQRLVDDRLYAGALSSRGAVRVLRLAWTVADLASVQQGHDVVPGVDEVEVAYRLRIGDPLLTRTVERRAAG